MQSIGRFSLWFIKLPHDGRLTLDRFTLFRPPFIPKSTLELIALNHTTRFEAGCLLANYEQLFPSLVVHFLVNADAGYGREHELESWTETMFQYARFRLALQRALGTPVRARASGVTFQSGQLSDDVYKTASNFRGRILKKEGDEDRFLDNEDAAATLKYMKHLNADRLRSKLFAVVHYDRGVWEERPCDRLLFYVMALESLFITKNERVAKDEAIAERCSSLLSRRDPKRWSGAKRKELAALLQRVYDFRSAFVHGFAVLTASGDIEMPQDIDLEELDCAVFDALWWWCAR